MEIEKQLHKSFENIGDWFLCCKLSIHSGEYKKTKAVFSASECKVKKVNGKLDFLLRQGKLHTLHEILCNGHFKPYTLISNIPSSSQTVMIEMMMMMMMMMMMIYPLFLCNVWPTKGVFSWDHCSRFSLL